MELSDAEIDLIKGRNDHENNPYDTELQSSYKEPSKRSRLARGLPAEFFPYYEFARALLSRRFSMFHVMRLLYGHINLNYVIN